MREVGEGEGERERGIIAYLRVFQSHISNRGYIMIIIILALYITWRYTCSS